MAYHHSNNNSPRWIKWRRRTWVWATIRSWQEPCRRLQCHANTWTTSLASTWMSHRRNFQISCTNRSKRSRLHRDKITTNRPRYLTTICRILIHLISVKWRPRYNKCNSQVLLRPFLQPAFRLIRILCCSPCKDHWVQIPQLLVNSNNNLVVWEASQQAGQPSITNSITLVFKTLYWLWKAHQLFKYLCSKPFHLCQHRRKREGTMLSILIRRFMSRLCR